MTNEQHDTNSQPGEVRSSEELGMRVGVRYVVTRASEDGEFQVGDRVRLMEDGSIMNAQAEGWMPAEDVPMATRGMQVAPDADWAAAMRADLERKLAELKHAERRS